MDEKIKTWPLRFPAKENPNMEKALFDWPIVLLYDSKAKYRLISLNQPKATRICIRSINQSNRFISVRLMFLFCSRVFISWSYENRSKAMVKRTTKTWNLFYKIVGKLVGRWCCAFYYPRMQKLERSSTFCIKICQCCAFNYRPKANLFSSKWRNYCVWRDSRVILSNQEAVFPQPATLNLICYKTGLICG